MIWAVISWYSAGPLIALNGRITANDYMHSVGGQLQYLTVQMFHNNDAIFQDDGSPIHTARRFHSKLAEHEEVFPHLPCPSQSPELNIIKPPWPVLESNVTKGFPLPTTRFSSRRVAQYSTRLYSEPI